jgi:hypothetical protein
MKIEGHHVSGKVDGEYLDPEAIASLTVPEHVLEHRIEAATAIGKGIDTSTWQGRMKLRLHRIANHVAVTLTSIEDPHRIAPMLHMLGDLFHKLGREVESQIRDAM